MKRHILNTTTALAVALMSFYSEPSYSDLFSRKQEPAPVSIELSQEQKDIYSITLPEVDGKREVDKRYVYFGSISQDQKEYSSFGSVNLDDVVTATPEYEDLVKKSLEKGTGRYWIKLAEASDKAIRAIISYGTDQGMSFIVDADYLSTFDIRQDDKPVSDLSVFDITDKVIAYMQEKGSK